MNSYILLALLSINLIAHIQADDINKCRVDTNTETNSVSIYCYYLELDDKDVPLDSSVPKSDYLSLHLIKCNGSIDENSFRNIKDLNSISIGGPFEKFVLPALLKLSSILMNNLQTPTIKGAFKNVQNTLTAIVSNKNSFVINDDDFEGLTNIKRLEIVKQDVTSLRWLKDLKKLDTLIVTETEIEDIPKNTFENNPGLTSIQFSRVPIKTIENGAFDPLTNLTMLLLTTTNLTTFDWQLTKNLKNLNGLGIPARSVKSIDVKKLFENSPNFSTFYFLEGDTKCSEIRHLEDEIYKYKKFVGVAFSDYGKTC